VGYVVTARWKARAGEGARVRGLIELLIAPSRAEAGCRFYQPSADPDDPEAFFFFEIYDDEAAYQAHGASPHFQEIGFGQAIPLLESRERKFYETLGG
jgi:quinol monooxygenase YgiN